jgi:hypothetical protein
MCSYDRIERLNARSHRVSALLAAMGVEQLILVVHGPLPQQRKGKDDTISGTSASVPKVVDLAVPLAHRLREEAIFL